MAEHGACAIGSDGPPRYARRPAVRRVTGGDPVAGAHPALSVVKNEKARPRRRGVEVRAQPSRDDWAGLLTELAKQLDSGRVDDRHLPDTAVAIDEILRSNWRPASQLKGPFI